MAGLEEPWKPLRSAWQTTRDDREKPPYTPPNEVFCVSFLNYRHMQTFIYSLIVWTGGISTQDLCRITNYNGSVVYDVMHCNTYEASLGH